MIPKTELRYSRIYNQILTPKFKRKDFYGLKRKFSRFEQLYKTHIKEILKLIEKYGNRWRRQYIPIYLVDKAFCSFSDPLTLKYRKNEKYLLVVLSHELLHNNLIGSWKNVRDLHEHMEPILDKVVSNLSINLDKELKRFNSNMKSFLYRKK